MKKILLLSVVGVSLVFGSATIFSGKTQSVSFSSEPEGAIVLLDNVQKCKTPCTLSLEKDEYKSVIFKKDGYKSKTLPMETSFNSTTFLGVLGGYLGFLSTTTDMATGAAYEYSPNNYFIELKKSDKWDFNNGFLDYNTKSELIAYILIHFNDIKLESKTGLGSFSKNLALMISKDYKIDFESSYKMVQLSAKESKTHIEFLKKLRDKLKK